MNEQTEAANCQRWHKLILAMMLVLYSSVATVVAENKILAFYPKLQDKNSQLDLTIRSDAAAGMGKPNAPVKFTVKVVNNGKETIDGMLGWSINLSLIHI